MRCHQLDCVPIAAFNSLRRLSQGPEEARRPPDVVATKERTLAVLWPTHAFRTTVPREILRGEKRCHGARGRVAPPPASINANLPPAGSHAADSYILPPVSHIPSGRSRLSWWRVYSRIVVCLLECVRADSIPAVKEALAQAMSSSRIATYAAPSMEHMVPAGSRPCDEPTSLEVWNGRTSMKGKLRGAKEQVL